MENVKELFLNMIKEKRFPCIGAKSLMKTMENLNMHVLDHEKFTDLATAKIICEEIYKLSSAYTQDAFISSVFIFPSESFCDNHEAEYKLWTLLKNIYQFDRVSFEWQGGEDAKYVYSKKFSMSIGGYSHFIPLMSPVADESARRFKYVALVFNPHIIFQNLRNKGLFESFRNIIRRNVEKYHGGSNPKIGDYGMTFEAPQYALTKESFFIGNCPFTGKKGIALHYKRKRCPLY